MEWRSQFDAELRTAEAARARGNEGQARVCARRAAGIVAQEYFARRGLAARSSSALDVLYQLMTDASLPEDLLPLLDHLVQQVNSEFKLAPGVDLLADARMLLNRLLPR